MLNQIDQNSFLVKFKAEIANIFPETTEKIALLVSSEYEGYYKNGGIGTYYNALSRKMDEDGWHVILLLCATENRFQGKSETLVLKQVFSVAEIEEILELQPVHHAILAEARSDYYDCQSFCVLFFIQALLARCSSTQIYAEFPEMCGFGYRTIQAKQVGLIPQCVTSVTLHSGHEWVYEANEKFTIPYPPSFWQICHYEQNSFENADLNFHPSKFIRSKVESYGWNADKAIRLPYFVPLIQPVFDANQSSKLIQSKRTEDKIPLIFFARLEERKGLCTFIKAIKCLEPSLASRCHLIFLGKVVQLYSYELRHLDSEQYIAQELGDAFGYDIYPNMFSTEALDLIRNLRNGIVCLTSPQDNFPNSALEVGQLPVSIVAADTGGFKETLGLLERSSCVHWFQPRNVQSLTKVLTKVLETHPESPKIPTLEFLGNLNQFLLKQRKTYIDEVTNQSTITQSTLDSIMPLVTINVVYNDGNLDLLECLSSLYRQSYKYYQIIVLDVSVESKEAKKILEIAKTQFVDLQVLRFEYEADTISLQGWLTLIQKNPWALFWTADDIADTSMLKTLIDASLNAKTSVALSPALVGSQKTYVNNLRLGFVSQLLTSPPRDINFLVKTKLLDGTNWSLDLSINTLTMYILSTVITTGEKIAYFPYPLYWKKNSVADNQDVILRKSYQIRQYVFSLAPSDWNIRQLYMLEMGIQQLSLKSGIVLDSTSSSNQSIRNLAGYDVNTLIKASAWKLAKKFYARIARYDKIKFISSTKRLLSKFFAENN